jgi:cyclohexyl-isocyanide hydratase
MNIGSLIFPKMDQADFTVPFEVLSRIPNATVHVLWKDKAPVTDVNGLVLTPTTSLEECPALDVLHVPGGIGQEALMEDETVLRFVGERAVHAQFVLSVCTGALICGAAGLLKGRRATTHWAAFELLPFFGATAVKERYVVDGKLITTAGVTAGMDGALHLAAVMCGEKVAQEIQLEIEYAPAPPFESGTPETAPSDVLATVREGYRKLVARRRVTAERVAKRIGVEVRGLPT